MFVISRYSHRSLTFASKKGAYLSGAQQRHRSLYQILSSIWEFCKSLLKFQPYLFTCLYTYLLVCLSICVSCLPICLIRLSYLSIYLSACLSFTPLSCLPILSAQLLFICPFVCLSGCLLPVLLLAVCYLYVFFGWFLPVCLSAWQLPTCLSFSLSVFRCL